MWIEARRKAIRLEGKNITWIDKVILMECSYEGNGDKTKKITKEEKMK